MKDDKTLRQVLDKKIKQFVTEFPKTAFREVERIMATKYNVKYGDTVDIFNGISPHSVYELDYNMLYKFMTSIRELALSRYTELDPSDLQAEKYFTESEIIEFEKPLEEEDTDYDLVITEWKQVNPQKFTVYLDTNEKIKWRNYNKLRFNPETQRDLVEIKSRGVSIKKLDINRNAINSMKTLMNKGLYFPVRGTININPDYYEPPRIEGKNLIIPMESHMDLIEGFHNYIAETELKDENPNFNMQTEFDIMLLTTDEANMFILQMDKKTHFKKTQVVRLDKTDENNYVVDRLNKNTDFHLCGTIDNDMKVFLNKVLNDLFEIKNREQALELFEKLETDLNYVIEKNKQFNQPFSKYEWFIYLNFIKHSMDSKISFKNIINKVDIQALKEKLNIVNTPLSKHYKQIRLILSGVKEDVL